MIVIALKVLFFLAIVAACLGLLLLIALLLMPFFGFITGIIEDIKQKKEKKNDI